MGINIKRRILSCIIILLITALVCIVGYVTQEGRKHSAFGKMQIKNQEEKAETVGRKIAGDMQSEQAESTDKDSKKIALTFDDGPDGTYTELLLDGLQKRSVKATFFVMGKKAEEFPELVQRMSEEGHLIGNHTYSHMQLSKQKTEEFKAELQKTSEIIEGITGEQPIFVRPPFGTWDRKFENELNMFPVLWTIDPLDWCSDDTACIVRNVVSRAEENDIILMHDQYKSSVTAALQIVDELQALGYEFVTVEEILFD